MQTPSPSPAKTGLWITFVAALVYCVWLAIHWLPLGYSDKEALSAVKGLAADLPLAEAIRAALKALVRR